MAKDTLLTAREILRDVTPLNMDCGALCSARCCKSNDVGEGMCLFPGEDALYDGSDWAVIYKTRDPQIKILVCGDTCPRTERPLACRIFPLTPVVRRGKLRVRMDARADGLCPLFDSGREGLSRDFVEKVTEAMEVLWEDEGQRTFLEKWGKMHDEYETGMGL